MKSPVCFGITCFLCVVSLATYPKYAPEIDYKHKIKHVQRFKTVQCIIQDKKLRPFRKYKKIN